MLGDYYKDNPQVATIVDAAIEVVKWFNNHSFCLGLLNEEQMTTFKKIWALILPVIAWWTSNFCAISWIFQVNKATKLMNSYELIEYVGSDVNKVAKAKRVLNCVVDDSWWKELAMCI